MKKLDYITPENLPDTLMELAAIIYGSGDLNQEREELKLLFQELQQEVGEEIEIYGDP